jgi:chaperone required for assembly of F1-ATPase
MGTRGRTSMAALMVPNNPTEIVHRPDAPDDLTDEQAEEWRAIVNTMPADHFMRGNYALLTQYCRHVIAARRIAQLIEQVAKKKDLDRRELASLLAQQSQESRAIARLLRSMRLSQQSVMRSEITKHPLGPTKRPWDREV